MNALLLDIARFPFGGGGRRPLPEPQMYPNPDYPQTAEDSLSVQQLQEQFDQLDSSQVNLEMINWEWASSSASGADMNLWIIIPLVSLGVLVLIFTYFKKYR